MPLSLWFWNDLRQLIVRTIKEIKIRHGVKDDSRAYLSSARQILDLQNLPRNPHSDPHTSISEYLHHTLHASFHLEGDIHPGNELKLGYFR